MRVSELSARAAVPLPTIKFYIREGLLPPGRVTGRNQAEYSEQHLERISLIRSLRDDAGLTIAAIARALRAADSAKHGFLEAALAAIERPAGPSVSERSREFAAAKSELLRLLQGRGWRVAGDEYALADAARALALVRHAFPDEPLAELAPYAEAVEVLSKSEIPESWAPSDAPEAALRYALLGTLLFEPFLLALRRLAHATRARTLEASSPRRGAPSKPRAADASSARTQEIYRVVRSIPRGKVATYGQVAELAGIHAGHRLVAKAMRGCPEQLPWQRVVGKKDARRARIAIEEPEHAERQQELLQAEGVRLDESGYVSLREFGWLPPDLPRAGRAR